MSVQARDRKIESWYNKIRFGEIKLPRFQRHEAWDKGRISSLLTTIMHDLPLGITLILEKIKEQFILRYLISADQNERFTKVTQLKATTEKVKPIFSLISSFGKQNSKLREALGILLPKLKNRQIEV